MNLEGNNYDAGKNRKEKYMLYDQEKKRMNKSVNCVLYVAIDLATGWFRIRTGVQDWDRLGKT